ncbi:MAG: flagellar hook-associated protein 3 [Candidatus Eisenbacteria bacterium]|nr:flagellar hook-associated protein 3 [Candidatus Latescibacterota bacterium]MBD3300965.1 flagellar hook-associated protein 3 [Candidatus Eisenbacteria bacterium]
MRIWNLKQGFLTADSQNEALVEGFTVRVTSGVLLQNALQGLKKNLDRLELAQRRVATGRRVHRASDDPAAVAEAMRLRGRLADLSQFQRNTIAAGTRLGAEQAVLDSLETVLERSREIADELASGGQDAASRTAALEELSALKEQIVALGNTTLGNEYLFGGARSRTPPFSADGDYAGGGSPRRIEIAEGTYVDGNHSGEEIFVAPLEAIDRLVEEIAAGEPDGIGEAARSLAAASDAVVRVRGEVGTRLGRVEDAQTRLAQESARLLTQSDALLNADPTEAAVEVVVAQTAMEQAYAAVAKILKTSILPYMH